ncbi:MAG: FkbM family methyltransferase [Niveispirillum sp.]|uniref:FkbM family methyltransferase n=1 Tax=Niveispirillum sp. TaxID=1917217 RepID=UPI004035D35F
MLSALEIIAKLRCPMPKGVVQVGANAGQELQSFYDAGVHQGVFIEPLDAPFTVLQRLCASVPGYLPIQAVCGARDGEDVTFHVANNFGASSSTLKPLGHLEDYPHVDFVAEQKLTSFTLDRVMDTVHHHRPDLSGNLSLLYMDVQGAELSVLKGATRTLQHIDYIYTEIGLGDTYENDVAMEDLFMFLKMFGFRLVEMTMIGDGAGGGGAGNAFLCRYTDRRWGR